MANHTLDHRPNTIRKMSKLYKNSEGFMAACQRPVAEFIDLLLEDKVNSGRGLSLGLAISDKKIFHGIDEAIGLFRRNSGFSA
jgi:hypothetical protein